MHAADEYDVFMDEVNRQISAKLLVCCQSLKAQTDLTLKYTDGHR
jgi:hypothetical protein